VISFAEAPAMFSPTPTPRDCEKVVRALWDYLDRALEAADMAAIDAHLAVCARCRPHAIFARRLVSEIGALRTEHDDPAELRSRVLDMLRRAREDRPGE
jgi:anti-sigma factor (TIGR02949 family)